MEMLQFSSSDSIYEQQELSQWISINMKLYKWCSYNEDGM